MKLVIRVKKLSILPGKINLEVNSDDVQDFHKLTMDEFVDMEELESLDQRFSPCGPPRFLKWPGHGPLP
ncbi:hypothetical protein TNCV_4656141 [Trichonephila clavipes]|nr:hypothetical protein TNCV_4656141 [Trichonephila clavipes]